MDNMRNEKEVDGEFMDLNWMVYLSDFRTDPELSGGTVGPFHSGNTVGSPTLCCCRTEGEYFPADEDGTPDSW